MYEPFFRLLKLWRNLSLSADLETERLILSEKLATLSYNFATIYKAISQPFRRRQKSERVNIGSYIYLISLCLAFSFNKCRRTFVFFLVTCDIWRHNSNMKSRLSRGHTQFTLTFTPTNVLTLAKLPPNVNVEISKITPKMNSQVSLFYLHSLIKLLCISIVDFQLIC